MKMIVQKSTLEQFKTKVLVVGFYEDETTELEKRLDVLLSGMIKKAREEKTFTAGYGKTKMITPMGKIPAENVMIVGLGKAKEITIDKLRRLAQMTAKTVRHQGFKEYTIMLHNHDVLGRLIRDRAQAVAEGIYSGLYEFSKYKPKEHVQDVDTINFLCESWEQASDVNVGIKKAGVLGEAINFVRDAVNEQASIMTPVKLAELAKGMHGVEVKILGKDAIKKLGMGGMEAVSRGSVNEPRFIVAEYNATKAKRTIALVGKGITFDSGGMDIKPTDGMETMKCDMAGAATVLAVVQAAATLRLPVNVIAFAPCTENMVSSMSYKPGDIIKSYNKKTIEIMNTDAEGRLVLADALAYAEKEYKPDVIVDLATLTGACVIALGSISAGMMTNNDELGDRLKRASEESGEKLWQMPLYPEYKEWIKSKIADVRNTQTKKREAGTSTAGAFLSCFVEKTPWAHLDIAGTAWQDNDDEYSVAGGTGYGVRLLMKMLEGWE